MEKDLKLIIPLAVYRKIMAYVTICDLEISGFAEVEYNENRHAFVIGEPYLIKQNVTGTGTHMEEEDVSKFNHDYIKAGGTQLPRLWWHSHVNMAAFFSSIDEETLKELQNDTFIIALVLNKHKEFKAKCYIYQEVEKKIMGVTFSSAEWVEIDPLYAEVELDYEKIPEALKKEVEKKVTEKKVEFDRSKWEKKTDSKLPYDNPLLRKTITTVQRLPKDPEEAMARIEALDARRTWSTELQEWVYEDKNGNLWQDYWDAVKPFDTRTWREDS